MFIQSVLFYTDHLRPRTIVLELLTNTLVFIQSVLFYPDHLRSRTTSLWATIKHSKVRSVSSSVFGLVFVYCLREKKYKFYFIEVFIFEARAFCSLMFLERVRFGVLIWAKCQQSDVILPSVWRQFGVSLTSVWRQFGVILTSVWRQFAIKSAVSFTWPRRNYCVINFDWQL